MAPALFPFQTQVQNKVMSKTNSQLSIDQFDADPFIQFEKWYLERLCSGVEIPNTMSVATSAENGRPSLRTVLLKEYDKTGFVFYTNYESKKGSQLTTNPYAAVLFYWPELNRQVRIEGKVEKVSNKDSDTYFASRPLESQVSAWASPQSKVIPERAYLEERFREFSDKFLNRQIPRPENWGGYRIIPSWFEFWQDGEFRLHDRIAYSFSDNKWNIFRLAP
jgi:pyridoxamine 5'-phosphate oxidase